MTGSRWFMISLGVVAAVVLAALGWVTHLALRLEKAEVRARADAEHQEVVRLVLWRMDAVVTPLIAREAARPYFHYLAFYPAGRAYTRMWREVEPGEVLVPSPLLNFHDPLIRLHYQRDERGAITSPQAPEGEVRSLAQSLYLSSYALASAEQSLSELQAMLTTDANEALRARVDPDAARERSEQVDRSPQQIAQTSEYPQVMAQQEMSTKEYMARQAAATRANVNDQVRIAGITVDKAESGALPSAALVLSDAAQTRRDAADVKLIAMDEAREPVVTQGTFMAQWRTLDGDDSHLLLTRSVEVQTEPGNAQRLEQGLWINWTELRRVLLAQSIGLLPGADLAPHTQSESPAAAGVLGRSLAAIPVELVVPPPPTRAIPVWSPMRGALLGAWIVALAALASIALVMRAATELAERRGRFVSAVTHELRTPLTTFCLYSQMLADGMVRDEAKKQDYIQTLRRESGRLAGIVESVLDYARLGRGNSNHAIVIGVVDLVARLEPSLRSRCEQCGMDLVIEDHAGPDARVRVDPARFERIVVNLVDNACKYASSADDKRVIVGLSRAGRDLEVRVRDHGPGLNPAESGHVFRPFFRGKAQADGSSPGLGLGLSLARGLARELGGDLRVGRPQTGAEFVLTTPLA